MILLFKVYLRMLVNDMIKLKIKKSKLDESGPSGNIQYGLIKSDDPAGLIYTLIDCSKLEGFCSALKNNYESNGVDPDISEDILLRNNIVISSLRVGKKEQCGGFSSALTSGVWRGYRGGRLGEKLYRYVFSQHPEGLTPDRDYVSGQARKLWYRLADYPDIKGYSLPQECQTYGSSDPDRDLLNRGYKSRGENASTTLSSAESCLDSCAETLSGLWDRDTLIYMIDEAGRQLFAHASSF